MRTATRLQHSIAGLVGAAALAAVLPAPVHAYDVNVVVDASVEENAISPDIFGIRMAWPAFYNGYSSFVQMQTEYVDAMDQFHSYMPIAYELRPTVLHYPFGLPLANQFPWKFSIGRFDQRPILSPAATDVLPDKRVVLGLDEFMQIVEDFDAQAVIAVPIQETRFGNQTWGTIIDAADMVEYLNTPNDGSNPHPDGLAPDDPANIDWAQRRADNGHPEPYGVKYFEMGVETRHGLIWSQLTYAKKFCDYSTAMKAIDPTISFGAVGDDSPFHFDIIQDVGERFEKWFEITGNFIEDFCGEDGTDRIGFWQRHLYSPGASKPRRGFDMGKQGNFVEVDVDFPVADDWTFRIPAMGGDELNPQPADLGVYIDDVQVTEITVDDLDDYFVTVPLTAGTHTIKLVKEDPNAGGGGNTLKVYHQLIVRDSTETEEVRVDFKDSPQLMEVIQGGHLYKALFMNEPAEWLRGAPVFVTEWNSLYDEFVFAVEELGLFEVPGEDIRESVNVGGYFEVFTEGEMQLATFHQLFEDHWYGLIEGVAQDEPHDERGRPAETLRRRPNFHTFKLYRENMHDTEVQALTDSPTYNLGPSNGLVMGGTGIFEEVVVDRLTVLASKSDDGTEMSVILRNKDGFEDAAVSVDLSGFTFDPTVRVQTITSPNLGDNNEPEPDSCSHPPACEPQVTLRTSTVNVASSVFDVTVPKHSIVAYRFLQAGADKTPPAVPTGFLGTITPENDQVTLSWDQSGDADFSHYNVYKARNAYGPFGSVVATLPQATTGFVDTAVFAGDSFSYAITAVDASGNESDKTSAAVFAIPDDTPPPTGGCAAVPAGAGAANGWAGWLLLAGTALAVGRRMRRR